MKWRTRRDKQAGVCRLTEIYRLFFTCKVAGLEDESTGMKGVAVEGGKQRMYFVGVPRPICLCSGDGGDVSDGNGVGVRR